MRRLFLLSGLCLLQACDFLGINPDCYTVEVYKVDQMEIYLGSQSMQLDTNSTLNLAVNWLGPNRGFYSMLGSFQIRLRQKNVNGKFIRANNLMEVVAADGGQLEKHNNDWMVFGSTNSTAMPGTAEIRIKEPGFYQLEIQQYDEFTSSSEISCGGSSRAEVYYVLINQTNFVSTAINTVEFEVSN